jgi:PAS domain S-box-containing protein
MTGGGGRLLVREIMSGLSESLRPGSTLRDALLLLHKTRLEGVPVMDAAGRVAGIYTRSHLYTGLLQGDSLDSPVERSMVTTVVTLHLDTPASTVLREVRTTAVGQAVVVDSDGRAVGMITKVDVIRALLRETDLLTSELMGIIQALHEGVLAVDADGCITIVNPEAERLLGCDRADVVGRRVAEVFPEVPLNQVLVTGVGDFARRIKLPRAAVIANTTPVKLGDAVVGAISSFHDLTELESVARELESVKKLQSTTETILDSAYDGILVVDENGIVTMVNRAMSDFLGRPAEDVLGRHCTEVLENSRLHVVSRTGVPELSQIQVIRGRRFVVSRIPIVKDGKLVGAVGKVIFRNLQDLQELARRMDVLESQVAYYKGELDRVAPARYTFEDLVTSSVEFRRLIKQAEQVARSEATVLVLGESGTGKELFAHGIHNASPRVRAPFIKVNCAAVPTDLLESEFFGYTEGAFTGAKKGGKPGKFELADGGTIFLDEIGDMSPTLQAKLLRVLQDHEVERVGGTHSVKVNVRVIAASNKDLDAMVASGKFREDLYYRLNVVSLQLIPLRERPEDILPLTQAFIAKYNRIAGLSVKGLTPSALAALSAYHWPGNVRELENVITRAISLDVADLIDLGDLPDYIAAGGRSESRRPAPRFAGPFHPDRSEAAAGRPADAGVGAQAGELDAEGGRSLRELLLEAECRAIALALERTGGNRTQAAKLLGLSRTRFYEKLSRCNRR